MLEEPAEPTRRISKPHLRPVRHSRISSSRLNKISRNIQMPPLQRHHSEYRVPSTASIGATATSGSAPRAATSPVRGTWEYPRNRSFVKLPHGLGLAGTRSAARRSQHAGENVPRAVLELDRDSDVSEDEIISDEPQAPTDLHNGAHTASPTVLVDRRANSESVSPGTVPPSEVQRPQTQRADSQLSIRLVRVEPTPPQVSNETVVSVTNPADAASTLTYLSSGSRFLEEGDLVSTAMRRTSSSADVATILGQQNLRTQPRQRIHHQSPLFGDADPGKYPHLSPATSAADRKEFSRIFQEYMFFKQFQSSVLESFARVAGKTEKNTSKDVPHKKLETAPAAQFDTLPVISPRLVGARRASSLEATTINQMANLSLDPRDHLRQGNGLLGVPSHSNHTLTQYILNDLWNQGYRPPSDLDGATSPKSPDSIHTQAQKVHQRIAAPTASRQRRNSSIKLV